MYDGNSQTFDISVVAGSDNSFQQMASRTNSTFERMEQTANRALGSIKSSTTENIAQMSAYAAAMSAAILSMEGYVKSAANFIRTNETIHNSYQSLTGYIQQNYIPTMELAAASTLKSVTVRASMAAGLRYITPVAGWLTGAYAVGAAGYGIGSWAYGKAEENENNSLLSAQFGVSAAAMASQMASAREADDMRARFNQEQSWRAVGYSQALSPRMGMTPQSLRTAMLRAYQNSDVLDIPLYTSGKAWPGAYDKYTGQAEYQIPGSTQGFGNRENFQILADTLKKLGEISDPLERANKAYKIFGDMTVEIWPHLNEEMEHGIRGVERFGLVMPETSRRNLAEFKNDMDSIGRVMDRVTSGAWWGEFKQGLKTKIQSGLGDFYAQNKRDFALEEAAIGARSADEMYKLRLHANERGFMTRASVEFRSGFGASRYMNQGIDALGRMVLGPQSESLVDAMGEMGRLGIDFLSHADVNLPLFLTTRLFGVGAEPVLRPGTAETESTRAYMASQLAGMLGKGVPTASQALGMGYIPPGVIGPTISPTMGAILRGEDELRKWRQSREGLTSSYSEAMAKSTQSRRILEEGGWMEMQAVKGDDGTTSMLPKFHSLTDLERFQYSRQMLEGLGSAGEARTGLRSLVESQQIARMSLESERNSRLQRIMFDAGSNPIAQSIAKMRVDLARRREHLGEDENGNPRILQTTIPYSEFRSMQEMLHKQIMDDIKKESSEATREWSDHYKFRMEKEAQLMLERKSLESEVIRSAQQLTDQQFAFSDQAPGVARDRSMRALQLSEAQTLNLNPRASSRSRIDLERRRLGIELGYLRDTESNQAGALRRRLDSDLSGLEVEYYANPDKHKEIYGRMQSLNRKYEEDKRELAIKTQEDITAATENSAIRSAEIAKNAYEQSFSSIKESAGHLFDTALLNSKNFAGALKQVVLSAFLTPVREGFSNWIAGALAGRMPQASYGPGSMSVPASFMSGITGGGGFADGWNSGGIGGGGFSSVGTGFDYVPARLGEPQLFTTSESPLLTGLGFGYGAPEPTGPDYLQASYGSPSIGSPSMAAARTAAGGTGGIGGAISQWKRMMFGGSTGSPLDLIYNRGTIDLGRWGGSTTAQGIGGWGGESSGGFGGMLTSGWQHLKGGAAGVATSPLGKASLMMGGSYLAQRGLMGKDMGTWKGVAEGTAGGAMIGFTMGGPFGALIGAGVGFGIGLGEKIFGVESKQTQAKHLVKSIYGFDINNGMADQIVGVAQSKYGGTVSVAVRDPEIRQALELFAMGTGRYLPPSASTPRGGAIEEIGGHLYQTPMYQYGRPYSYQSSIPTVAGIASQLLGPSGSTYLSLHFDGQSAGDMMTGQFVTPTVVANKFRSAAAMSQGRLSTAAALMNPGLQVGV